MIYVCDAIMGSGKSSAAIAMMNANPEKRFLYVTPYNDEVDRIVKACTAIRMDQPDNLKRFRDSKVAHTEWLTACNKNVASTHQAFVRYNPEFLTALRERHYTLIIDENISPLQHVKVSRSYVLAAQLAGLIDEILPGVYRLRDKKNRGDFDEGLFRIMQSHDLMMVTNDKKDVGFYWIMPPEFLQAFDDVYILTYLFEGQGLYAMMRMYNLPFQYIGIEHNEQEGSYAFSLEGKYVPESANKLRSLIHVVRNEKMNAEGEGYFSYSKGSYEKHSIDLQVVKKHLQNFFTNLYPTPVGERMWSTFADYRDVLKGNGYASRFRALNLRATNNEASSRVLAYMVNLFTPRWQTLIFRSCGVDTNDNLYALSTMVQWIWRSAIRNGKHITIYLPSRRMRELLIGWMDDLAVGADPKKRLLEINNEG